jgi:hypothetical protein
LFLNYRRNKDEAKYLFPNYRRNEDEAKYLLLNYRRNEDEAKYSFPNYQRNEDEAKYSFLKFDDLPLLVQRSLSQPDLVRLGGFHMFLMSMLSSVGVVEYVVFQWLGRPYPD